MTSVTRVLTAIQEGDARAAEELLPVVYEELRRLAAQRLAHETPGQTLQPTALVHEVWLRLVGDEDPGWEGRAHFFGAAAEAMRRVLIDRARAKGRVKRGGGMRRIELRSTDLRIDEVSDDLLALDEALTQLATEDRVKAELVKLRFFGGLAMEEAARMLGISPATADRYWAYARAWLYRRMTKGKGRLEA